MGFKNSRRRFNFETEATEFMLSPSWFICRSHWPWLDAPVTSRLSFDHKSNCFIQIVSVSVSVCVCVFAYPNFCFCFCFNDHLLGEEYDTFFICTTGRNCCNSISDARDIWASLVAIGRVYLLSVLTGSSSIFIESKYRCNLSAPLLSSLSPLNHFGNCILGFFPMSSGYIPRMSLELFRNLETFPGFLVRIGWNCLYVKMRGGRKRERQIERERKRRG